MSSFALRVAALMGFAVPDEPVEPIIPMVSPPGTYTMSYSRLATGETLYTGPGADTVTDEINSIRKLIICMMIYDMKSAVFDVKDVQFLSSDDDFLSPWTSARPPLTIPGFLWSSPRRAILWSIAKSTLARSNMTGCASPRACAATISPGSRFPASHSLQREVI